MKTISVVLGLVVTLAVFGCSAGPQSGGASTSSPASGSGSASASAAMPPTLTAGDPIRVSGSSSRGFSAVQLHVLGSHRYASVEEVARVVGFTPGLPRDTGGTSLEYLLAGTPGPRDSRGLFWAVYSGGRLQFDAWRPLNNERWQPLGMVATQTVHGLPATINPRDQQGQATVLWKEGGIMHNLWYTGSLEDAVRIANSFPRQ